MAVIPNDENRSHGFGHKHPTLYGVLHAQFQAVHDVPKASSQQRLPASHVATRWFLLEGLARTVAHR